MIEDSDITELDDATDDPAGGMVLPPSRREIARARALAGVAVGLSAMFGIAAWTPPTSITSITA